MHTNVSRLQGQRPNLFWEEKGRSSCRSSAGNFWDRILTSRVGLMPGLQLQRGTPYRRLDPHFEAPNQIPRLGCLTAGANGARGPSAIAARCGPKCALLRRTRIRISPLYGIFKTGLDGEISKAKRPAAPGGPLPCPTNIQKGIEGLQVFRHGSRTILGEECRAAMRN